MKYMATGQMLLHSELSNGRRRCFDRQKHIDVSRKRSKHDLAYVGSIYTSFCDWKLNALLQLKWVVTESDTETDQCW